MSFRKFVKLPLIMIVCSILLAFVFDFITLMVYREDVRTQVYIGGFYIAGMAADPTALAAGVVNQPDLYKNEDILREFEVFSKASFGGMSNGEPQIVGSGNQRAMRFNVDSLMISDIITQVEILTIGSEKGVSLTVEYRVSPRLNLLLGAGVIPDYRMHMTRRFRLLGQ